MNSDRTRIFTEADAHLALAMAALEGADNGPDRDMVRVHAMLRKVREKIKKVK